uniref:Uncharacterized protein n=1 Tax=Zea mays TaxID=4577 RepID=A0A804MI06_MAIZE
MVHGSVVPSSVHAPAPPPTVIPPANPTVILLPRLPSILARPFNTSPVPLPSPSVLHHSTHAPLPSSSVLLPRPMRQRIRSTTSTTRSSLCCTRVATAADAGGATTTVVAQHASSLINSLGNSREGNPDRDGSLSMLFSKKLLAQTGWATGPVVAVARRGGPLPRARMEGRRGASAANERAADPAGDSAGAARRPARVHIHLPAALPGVRLPPPVRGRTLLCSRLPAINARHRTHTRYQHRPSWKVPEDPPPSSPTAVAFPLAGRSLHSVSPSPADLGSPLLLPRSPRRSCACSLRRGNCTAISSPRSLTWSGGGMATIDAVEATTDQDSVVDVV